jgi:hypothetical protein
MIADRCTSTALLEGYPSYYELAARKRNSLSQWLPLAPRSTA